MRIGIIGAGHIGRAVATLAVRHGHEVTISNSRGPETLAGLARELGCAPGSAEQAATFGDVVLIAIPLRNHSAIPAGLLAGKIVVDADNYYPDRDGHIAALDNQEITTSELLAQQLPSSMIMKAFNAILAKQIETDARPSGTAGRRALPITGNDTEARRLVAGLLDQLGFNVVDVGPLSESWRFERARPTYCVPMDKITLSKTLANTKRADFVREGSWRH